MSISLCFKVLLERRGHRLQCVTTDRAWGFVSDLSSCTAQEHCGYLGLLETGIVTLEQLLCLMPNCCRMRKARGTVRPSIQMLLESGEGRVSELQQSQPL